MCAEGGFWAPDVGHNLQGHREFQASISPSNTGKQRRYAGSQLANQGIWPHADRSYEILDHITQPKGRITQLLNGKKEAQIIPIGWYISCWSSGWWKSLLIILGMSAAQGSAISHSYPFVICTGMDCSSALCWTPLIQHYNASIINMKSGLKNACFTQSPVGPGLNNWDFKSPPLRSWCCKSFSTPAFEFFVQKSYESGWCKGLGTPEIV